MTTITLALNDGPFEIDAEVYGEWAVHRRLNADPSLSDEYRVTHAPTGLGVNAAQLAYELTEERATELAMGLSEKVPTLGLPAKVATPDDRPSAADISIDLRRKIAEVIRSCRRSGTSGAGARSCAPRTRSPRTRRAAGRAEMANRHIIPYNGGGGLVGGGELIVEILENLTIASWLQVGAVEHAVPPLDPVAACRLGMALQEAAAWAGRKRAEQADRTERAVSK